MRYDPTEMESSHSLNTRLTLHSEIKIGRHQIHRLPWSSATTSDVMEAGRRRHLVGVLLEFDVTIARERMRDIHRDSGEKVSFTGWLAYCVSQALLEFPEFNSHRHGSRQVVRFTDVDVMLVVEREYGGTSHPMPLVIRKANEMNVVQIHQKIRAAQKQELEASDMVTASESAHWLSKIPLTTRIYPYLPVFLRQLFWRMVGRRAFLAKSILGTVGITAVGMFGRFPGWPITTGLHTVNLAVGGITRKPAAQGDQVEIREMLALTIMANHDIVDGAPAARFLARFGEFIETGLGLDSSRSMMESKNRTKDTD